MNNDNYLNETYNKIVYDYTMLLIQEGLNSIAGQFLISILGKSNDTFISELYERLYFNCEEELSDKLPLPATKLIPIVIKSSFAGPKHTRETII